jgi:hypothetical protein
VSERFACAWKCEHEKIIKQINFTVDWVPLHVFTTKVSQETCCSFHVYENVYHYCRISPWFIAINHVRINFESKERILIRKLFIMNFKQFKLDRTILYPWMHSHEIESCGRKFHEYSSTPQSDFRKNFTSSLSVSIASCRNESNERTKSQ